MQKSAAATAPAPEPPPARTPERAALAEAIERAADAARQLVAVKVAQAAGEDQYFDARHAVAACQDGLETTKSAAGQHMAASLVGDVQTAPPSVADARVALQAATDLLEAAQASRVNLRNRLAEAERDSVASGRRVENAVKAVVQSDPATAKLVNDFEILRGLFNSTEGVFEWLRLRSFLPDSAKPTRADTGGQTLAAIRKWSAAVDALKTNADAELPS